MHSTPKPRRRHNMGHNDFPWRDNQLYAQGVYIRTNTEEYTVTEGVLWWAKKVTKTRETEQEVIRDTRDGDTIPDEHKVYRVFTFRRPLIQLIIVPDGSYMRHHLICEGFSESITHGHSYTHYEEDVYHEVQYVHDPEVEQPVVEFTVSGRGARYGTLKDVQCRFAKVIYSDAEQLRKLIIVPHKNMQPMNRGSSSGSSSSSSDSGMGLATGVLLGAALF